MVGEQQQPPSKTRARSSKSLLDSLFSWTLHKHCNAIQGKCREVQNTPGSPTDLIESGWVMGGPDLKVGVQNTPDLCRHLRPRAVWVIERLGQYQTYGYWHLNWGDGQGTWVMAPQAWKHIVSNPHLRKCLLQTFLELLPDTFQ